MGLAASVVGLDLRGPCASQGALMPSSVRGAPRPRHLATKGYQVPGGPDIRGEDPRLPVWGHIELCSDGVMG